MYIETVPNRGSPPAILLRESYRVGGKVKKRTLLNLSDWPRNVVEGRHHVVMAHQCLIAQRQILLCVAVQVAECCRETIAAVLAWCPAERPQRILQTLGQRHKALAAEHDVGMLEAREGQPEVV